MIQKPDTPVSEKEMKATPVLPRCVHCGGENEIIRRVHLRAERNYTRCLSCFNCHTTGPLQPTKGKAIAAYGKHARGEADALRDEIKVLKGKVCGACEEYPDIDDSCFLHR